MKSQSSTEKRGVTSADVAKLAGVHRSSVSVVLNGAKTNTGVSAATRERIFKAAAELNYVPDPGAQRLAVGRDRRVIALLMPDLDFDVTTGKAKAIQQALSQQGFYVPIHALGSYLVIDHPTFVAQICRQRPAAIVCNNWGLHHDALPELEQFQEQGGHLIAFDYPTTLGCDQVIFDREDNTYQAAKHLLELGHRDIGVWMTSPLQGARAAGFHRALTEYGVRPNPEWIMGSGNFLCNERNGADLAARIVGMKHRPTALCIVNDSASQACIAELQRAGIRVPHDISIVSHDDMPIALYGAVRLTTVSHPISEIAENLVAMLTERMESRYQGPPRVKTLRGTLKERDSALPFPST